jgi:glucose/arabinose dehydrogenase
LEPKKLSTYGNRNPQVAKNPATGAIWAHEHGPKVGMKSILSKGANYGWPVVTYGIDYDDTTISTEKTKPGIENPILLVAFYCTQWYDLCYQ